MVKWRLARWCRDDSRATGRDAGSLDTVLARRTPGVPLAESFNLPESLDFGGGALGSDMHPVVLCLTLCACALVLFLPRRYVFAPAVCGAALLPFGSQLYLGGLHFYVIRILAIAGAVRLLVDKYGKRQILVPGGITAFDRVFIAWAICRGIAQMFLFRDIRTVVAEVAFWLDTVGLYLLFRYSIQKENDILRISKVLAPTLVVMATCMMYEHRTGLNVYNLVTSYHVVPYMREGQVRAQAAFGHAITAGTFGTTLIPVFFWAWKSGKARVTGVVGLAALLVVDYAGVSSTPVTALVAALFGLFLWPLRRHMRAVRWSIVGSVAVLAVIMKAPVWYVIQKVDFVGGHGWDRAFLVDQFVRHFGQWWLFGTAENAKWASDTWVRDNQYVSEGLSGGLVTLVLFIVLLVMAFAISGCARKRVRGVRRWLYWCLGSALFAHIVAFHGVSYWDQMRVAWLLLLAIFPAAERWGVEEQRRRELGGIASLRGGGSAAWIGEGGADYVAPETVG